MEVVVGKLVICDLGWCPGFYNCDGEESQNDCTISNYHRSWSAAFRVSRVKLRFLIVLLQSWILVYPVAV